MDRKKLGSWGEQKAREYLESKGFVILEINYRCKLGEADIIAMDGDSLVFIEVKTRTSTTYGFPAESISSRKTEKNISKWHLFIQRKRNKRSLLALM